MDHSTATGPRSASSFRRVSRPSTSRASPRLIEALGFASVWLPEDAWDRGGIATLVSALERHDDASRVGLGIASAMVRYPAFLAMELATIAALHGDRAVVGIGLGVPAWLEQMGLTPRSQVGALRETMVALRRLLDGETLTERGERATYRDVRLTFPPRGRVPLLLGRDRSAHAGALGRGGRRHDRDRDGERALPALGARAHRGRDGRATEWRPIAAHRFVAYAWFAIDDDDAAALERVRPGIGAYLRREPASGARRGERAARRGRRAARTPRIRLRGGGPARVAAPVQRRRGPGPRARRRSAQRLAAGADEVALHPGAWRRPRRLRRRARARRLGRSCRASDRRAPTRTSRVRPRSRRRPGGRGP